MDNLGQQCILHQKRNPSLSCCRVEELRKTEAAANADRGRLQEALTEAQERLTVQNSERDALAAELQAARSATGKEQSDGRKVQSLGRRHNAIISTFPAHVYHHHWAVRLDSTF